MDDVLNAIINQQRIANESESIAKLAKRTALLEFEKLSTLIKDSIKQLKPEHIYIFNNKAYMLKRRNKTNADRVKEHDADWRDKMNWWVYDFIELPLGNSKPGQD